MGGTSSDISLIVDGEAALSAHRGISSVRRVLVPRVASVLSAWGMLATELRLESIRSHVGETDSLDAAAVRGLYEDMAREGAERMRGWFEGRIDTRRSAEMRYGEQIFEIDVPTGEGGGRS